MVFRLNSADHDFPSAFEAILGLKREVSDDVDRAVQAIISDVRARGDAALADYSARFDHVDLSTLSLRISAGDVAAARAQCSTQDLAALDLAASRIRAYHEQQKPTDHRFTDSLGVELGWRWSAVRAVGLYVPGGSASYPSSVLMNAIPAKVAGVDRIVMVVPTPNGLVSPLVLAAAEIAGVDEIYRVGGAQAIAALAYGTESIQPVFKIVGPGNAYVAAAKRQVFGQVGIDMMAGPSEVVIIADKTARADWIAADLLAQAEHDSASQPMLITDHPALGDAVAVEVDRQLASLQRAQIAGASWRDFGAIIIVKDLVEAATLSDRLAPEHLEIMTADPDAVALSIRDAGAIFLGENTPEAIGDYIGGSNHVLPTARSARFASGLGVYDFMKRTSFLRCGPAQLAAIGPAAVTLGEAEGLQAHARSVAMRLGRG
ncbi:HisD Histidinol dehydrogenase [Rhabdaerophilaceae bacterium]